MTNPIAYGDAHLIYSWKKQKTLLISIREKGRQNKVNIAKLIDDQETTCTRHHSSYTMTLRCIIVLSYTYLIETEWSKMLF